jgi:hypothetical protein
LAKDLLVKKQQGRQRLVLRSRGHLPLRGEVIEERSDFFGAEIRRMALAMEIDEALDPVDVRLLRAIAVMPYPDGVSNLR